MQQNNSYDESQIQVLEGLEPVRKRPGMYIGSTDTRGLHHLVYEVIDNSIDEAMAGFCTHIEIRLLKDGSAMVTDNGRGIPTGIHPKVGKSSLEVALTMLHAGGKFGGNGYKVSGGLHGVGVSVVNALSSKMIATVKREGKIFEQSYSRGLATSEVKITGETGDENETGTSIRFYPDPEIFDTVEFSYDTIRSRIREMAFLNKGIRITLTDERPETEISTSYHYEGGIKSFVEHMNKNREVLLPDVVYMSYEDGTYSVEVAMQYNESWGDNVDSFANNIKTPEGGTHVSGFRAALTKVVNSYAVKNNYVKNAEDALIGEDIRDGLVAIISVKMPEPQFEGQTKSKLGSAIMRTMTESVVTKGFTEYLEENPRSAKLIIEKSIMARNGREAARKAKELIRKKSDLFRLPDKLAECTSKDPKEREIFIVEGDSAGGSAKKGRDRKTQAILPLRGKILNVEKTRLDKALGNAEIKAMITAFGTGIGDDFDISKLRYHKIIIMTDADVDGSHIRTLLLTFFYRYMRPLVDEGYVYIAQPPLYRLKYGKTEKYVFSDKELRENIDALGENVKADVNRYKGLGEMNFDQLRDTTMKAETRTLLRVNSDSALEADATFTMLMGEEVEPRREFIEQNSKLVADLDI